MPKQAPLTAVALLKTTICSWGNVIRMNGYLFTETGIRMSEYSDICWNLFSRLKVLDSRPPVVCSVSNERFRYLEVHFPAVLPRDLRGTDSKLEDADGREQRCH